MGDAQFFSNIMYPLENISIGLWKVRKHRQLFVLMLRQQRKFVFVVVYEAGVQVQGRLERVISERVNQVLDIRGPFSLHQGDDADEHSSCVIAFEVDWSAIVGLDYKNCLLQEGRVVLECKSIPKRLFATVQDVREFYEWAPLLAMSGPNHNPSTAPANPTAPHPQLLRRSRTPNPERTNLPIAASSSSPDLSAHRRRSLSTSPAPDRYLRARSFSSDPLPVLSSVSAPTSHPLATISPRSNPSDPPKDPEFAFSTSAPSPMRPTSLNPPKQPLWPTRSPLRSSSCSSIAAHDSHSAPASTHSAPADLPSPGSPPPLTSPFLLNPPRCISPMPRRAIHPPPLLVRLRASTGCLGDLDNSRGDDPVRARSPGHVRSTSMQQLRSSFDVPSAARWTVPTATYTHSTLVVNFSDPSLPRQLALCIKDDLRLLKHYESGVPAWAVLLPSLGLFYRPWMRSATWALFLAVTLFSMACGFYDLYKNVPYLRQLAAAVAQQLHATSVLQWLEAHTQLRLSILLTYLFGKSPMFLALLRMLSTVTKVLTGCLRYVYLIVANLLSPLIAALRHFSLHILQTTLATLSQLYTLALCVALPPARILLSLLLLLAKLLQPLADLVLGPISAIGSALHTLLDTLFLPVNYLLSFLSFIRSIAALTSKLAGPATTDLASSATRSGLSAWLTFLPTDAVLLLRTSFMKVVRGVQAVVRFGVALGCTVNQHRISIMMQVDARWLRIKRRVLAPLDRVPVLRVASQWLLAGYDEGGASAGAVVVEEEEDDGQDSGAGDGDEDSGSGGVEARIYDVQGAGLHEWMDEKPYAWEPARM